MVPVCLLSRAIGSDQIRCKLDTKWGYRRPNGSSLECPNFAWHPLPGILDILQWSAHVARCVPPETVASKMEKVVAMYTMVIVRVRPQTAKDREEWQD